MTHTEIETALENHTRICGGREGTDEYDEGYIRHIFNRDTVMVGWQSGVATPAPISALRLV